jgi:hypothetical protein
MRPAIFSTDEPPQPITCVETLEYVQSLRRRIEVQNDQMEALASQAHKLLGKTKRLEQEVDKLALDLGITDGGPGVGWVEAPR